MNSSRKTPIVVVAQGRPIMSHTYGYLVRGNDEVVTFFVDLDSKYCEVIATGGNLDDEGPIIHIGETERSLHLGPPDNPDCGTAIQFPEFHGWDVHAADLSRYTLAVALTKRIAT